MEFDRRMSVGDRTEPSFGQTNRCERGYRRNCDFPQPEKLFYFHEFLCSAQVPSIVQSLPTRVGLSLGVPKLSYTPDSRSLARDWKRPSLPAIQLYRVCVTLVYLHGIRIS
jgi:hypothetical protein